MAEQGASWWARASEYLGFSGGRREYDPEHDYPGHICGIDCNREPHVTWYNNPKKLTRYTMFFIVYAIMLFPPKMLSYVVPIEWQTRPTRLIVLSLMALAIWLGVRQLARRIADHSQNEANRLLHVARGAKNATYLIAAYAALYYPFEWLLSTILGWFGIN